MDSHNPTWKDCEQILIHLFTAEERNRIRNACLTLIRAEVPAGTANATAWIEERCPPRDPQWNPNDATELNSIHDYQKLFVRGLRAAARKPTNLLKVRDLRQTDTESPDAFYERLLRAYQRYTPIDVDDPNNQREITLAFVAQSASDIRRKLSKKEGFAGLPIQYLLELARDVYDRREETEEKRKEQLEPAKTLTAALIDQPKLVVQPGTQSEVTAYAAPANPPAPQQPGMGFQQPWKGGKRLNKDTCARCKCVGHWARDCPYPDTRPPHLRGKRNNARGSWQQGGVQQYPMQTAAQYVQTQPQTFGTPTPPPQAQVSPFQQFQQQQFQPQTYQPQPQMYPTQPQQHPAQTQVYVPVQAPLPPPPPPQAQQIIASTGTGVQGH